MAAQSDADLEAAGWFFEHSLDLFLVIHDGVVTRVNPAWSAITGWTEGETVGRHFRDFGHRDETPLLDAALAELRAVGQVQTEHRLRTNTGAWLTVRTRAKLSRDGGYLMVMQDVTEDCRRKAAADEGQRANDLLREAAGITVWRYDPDQDLYEFDPDFSRPIGAKSADPDMDVRSRPTVQNVIHRDDGPELDRVWKHTLATGEAAITEYRTRRHDKTWMRVRTSWGGVRQAPSGRWEVLGITQDVTELSDARDAALKAAEAKSQFLANMSHEIRTPMNGVLGVLHLLKAEDLSADGRRLLEEALSCGQMLSELMGDIIDFSKIEAGRLELAPETVDAGGALQGVVALLKPQAEAKGLYLRAVVDHSVGWISADPVRLRQVLFNLIGNAVKFTLSGGVEARLIGVGAGAARRLRVEVEDTGVGIADEAKARLFLRFDQADNSNTREHGGVGLGLAITQKLAALMGGEIGFSSRLGYGSTFWVEIPAPIAESPGARPTTADGRWLADLRVLVVEDNPTNRMIATKMLETLGASVETADDGQQGVDAVGRQSFDLICMDIQMPVMDGITATRTIRAMAGPVGETPIIAMTANALAHQVETYYAAGMNGVVPKPVSPAGLLAELARLTTTATQAATALSA